MRVLQLENADDLPTEMFLRFARSLAGVGGWIAAIAAVGSFLTAALGGLSFPGR